MVEEKVDLESLLARAKDQEILHDWSGAAETYGNAVSIIPESDPRRIGETLERKAYANYKVALQAGNIDEFNHRADTAVEQYTKAKQSCERAGGLESRARMTRCEAMLAFLRFIRSAEVADRKKQANDSWELGMESLDGFASAGNGLEFCRTFNELCLSAAFASKLVPDYESRKKRMVEALNYGEKAIAFSVNIGNPEVAVRTLVLASSFWERSGYCRLCGEDPQTCHRKAVAYWQKAESLSKEAVLEALPLGVIIGDAPYDPNRDANNELRAFERSVEVVKKSGDRFLIGHALAGLSFYSHWLSEVPENKEDSVALMQRALDCAIEAGNEFSKIGFMADAGQNIWVMSPHLGYYSFSAYLEKDLEKKRRLAEKALEAWPENSRLAKLSGYTWHIASAEGWAGFSYSELAKTESDADRKRALLEKAVDLYGASNRPVELWDAGNLFNLGLSHFILADIQAELAEVMADRESKIRTLREAIELHEKGLAEYSSGRAAASLTEDAASNFDSGYSRSQLGRRYRSLHKIVGDPKILTRAVESFEGSADSFSKAGQPARAAESLWEAARAYDTLGEHLKASERFEEASEQYQKAAEKIKRLSHLYQGQSLYMKAWSEIEKARYHHARQAPASAKEHYNKAAELHESTGKWSFLSTNYFAWAQVENAEDLSQRERCKESIDAFREAARLFKDSKRKMLEHMASIESSEERQMVESLLEAADRREGLCIARIALEEARLLDKRGNMSDASEKYGLVADMLEKIKQELTSEQDRIEIQLIIRLSNAWKVMSRAEAEASPELYLEAARLFEEAMRLSPSDRAKNLTLGHSRFCKALAAGVQFADTGDTSLHSTATQNLESASKYYLKADLPAASDYAKASRLLFDSYVFMDKASKEEEQEKKAKLYAMTEKMLEASASSFVRADQHGKRDQVMRLLKKVREDRELASSLTDIFRAPDFASTTMAFSAPTPSLEKATGLEMFEHANLQAALIARPKDVNVGENFDLEIELVNAGRGVAQLTKVEEFIPKGFEVIEKPENYRIEDSCLNLKGKRLDALKTEDLKLILRPTLQGNFRLTPRIMYLDESGSYRSCEPEPINVRVKQLGITGWLKGPEKK